MGRALQLTFLPSEAIPEYILRKVLTLGFPISNFRDLSISASICTTYIVANKK